MKLFVISSILTFFVLGSSCDAGGSKPNRTVQDNAIKGEYVVVINKAAINSYAAQKELKNAIEKSEVKIISNNIMHIILAPSDDPGLEQIKSLLSKFKWVRAIEQNKEVHIS